MANESRGRLAFIRLDAMYVRQEAVLSSQIEWTRASLVELGLLDEVTGQARNRLFVYQQYLSLFEPQRPGWKVPSQGAQDRTRSGATA